MKPWVPALAALALISCGPLVQIGGNAKPPQSLLTLSATATPRPYAGPARTADTIGIDLPVTTNATETSYLVGATWAEQPNRQFQRLLADTLAANGIAVIDARQSAIAPARSITGSLRSFGLDMADPASPVVRVRYDAQLSGGKANAGQVALRRFDASEPAPSQSPTAVAAALNRAANRVAAEVAAWAQG